MKFSIDKIKQMTRKQMAAWRPHEGIEKKPHEGEMQKVLVPVAKAAEPMALQVGQATELREETSEPCLASLEILPAPLFSWGREPDRVGEAPNSARIPHSGRSTASEPSTSWSF